MANDTPEKPTMLSGFGDAIFEHSRALLVTVRVYQLAAQEDNSMSDAVRLASQDAMMGKSKVWECKREVEAWFEAEPSLSMLTEQLAG